MTPILASNYLIFLLSRKRRFSWKQDILKIWYELTRNTIIHKYILKTARFTVISLREKNEKSRIVDIF